jgi:hypothetical protein
MEPTAMVFPDCNVRLMDVAFIAPPVAFTEADWYVSGPGFTPGYADFPGPAGTAVSYYRSLTNLGPGVYSAYVRWTGSGLASLGVGQSPVVNSPSPGVSPRGSKPLLASMLRPYVSCARLSLPQGSVVATRLREVDP